MQISLKINSVLPLVYSLPFEMSISTFLNLTFFRKFPTRKVKPLADVFI